MNDLRLTELCNLAFDLFPFVNHNDDGCRKIRDEVYTSAFDYEQRSIENLSKQLAFYATNKPKPHEREERQRREHLDNIRCADAFSKVALRNLDDRKIKELLSHVKIDKKMANDYKKIHAHHLSDLIRKI